ncbi:hypothetical protein CK203_091918 [Vitis vinifera]|uniref:Integrase zinc-binding domain-containing protein n=1 Tax=Vitis vinifera TaxID=29760 RepID=A0A438BRH7_VITVI|nr:hypothetical protein CK203_091918 [Vitis vinifera]
MEHGNEEVFFFSSKTHYAWEDLYLYKFCPNQIIRRCVPKDEQQDILQMCHEEACGGHFAPMKTSTKILQSRFYWPTMFKDCYTHCKSCPQSQQLGKSTQEAVACKSNDHKVVLKFLKDNIFSRTAYKTVLGMSPYRTVYGKACHLLVELEHRAYGVIKNMNFDSDQAGAKRKYDLNELEAY